MDKARRIAVQALVRQEESGFANLVLNAVLEHQDLNGRDRAFVSALFYGVTERLLTLDWALANCLSRPLSKLDPQVRAILRSGLYQARYMQVPRAVAVNESVSLCRALKKSSAAGLVNAVLRKAVAQDPAAATFKTEAERLSIQYSVGLPVVKLLQKNYPEECEQILQAFFETPRVALRCNPLKTTPAQLTGLLEAEGVEVEPGWLANTLLAKFTGSPAATEAFQKGLYHVQGQASQLAAYSLQARPGEKVLDLCAAPGGKTLTIGQDMENTGTLISCDAVESRLPLIEKAAARAGLTNVKVLHNDASVYREEFAGADRVLCDVPCSGLGIIAKKPDIRYKTMDGVEQLHGLQAKILATAARYVKQGGRIVYSTCTIDPRENQNIVRAFLEQNADFRLVSSPFVPEGARVEDGMLTLLPGKAGPDGFFIAIMEKL